MERGFSEIFGHRDVVARTGDALARLKSSNAPSVSGLAPSMSSWFRDLNATRPTDVPVGIATLAGGAAGYYFMRGKHPVLGVVGGLSAGTNLPALLNDDTRSPALGNMLQTGSAIATSMYMQKNPIIGFVLGWLGGGLAAYVSGLKK